MDYRSISTEHGDALVHWASIPRISRIDSIIFDFDGVLTDGKQSVKMMHGASADLYFGRMGWTNCTRLMTPRDMDLFKLAGGFNNDWDLAYAWQLLYLYKHVRYGCTDGDGLRAAHPTIEEFTAEVASLGGGLSSAEEVVRGLCSADEWDDLCIRCDRADLLRLFQEVLTGDLCEEVYGFPSGTVTGPGLIRRDAPILDERLLPDGLRYGIATGRTAGETKVGIRLMGWSAVFAPDAVITEDDGFLKPDPRILELAAGRLGASRPLYVGDTPDDLLTAQRYRGSFGDILCAMVLTGLKQDGLRERFISGGADIIADNVNVVLAAVTQSLGGTLCPAERQS